MKKKKIFEEYCTSCGGRLIRLPKSANKLYVDKIFGIKIPLGSKFNCLTGKRQYGILVKCENKKFWNNCDEWVDIESLHDSDLEQLKNL